MNLFDNTDYEKLEKLDKAVDSIRKRFGTDSIKRASFVQQEEIDHISGGRVKEKIRNDWDKG
jgi:DNA polymerase-4